METLAEKLESIPKFDITGFKIVSRLAKGSFGKTYLASNGSEKVVIKKFNEDLGRPDIPVLIEREIRNLAFIKEDRLIIGFRGISFVGFNHELNDYPLLILDYAENGSLEDFLNKKSNFENNKLDDAQKMIFLYGIAKAMQFLHNFNIVHRDFKPANILLDKNFYPLISDFGSSRIIDQYSNKNITPTLGTLMYMAPEVFCGNFQEKISMKSDVFSYSMIIYYILTGKRPYDDIKKANTYKIINFLGEGRRLKLPDQIPSYFKHLITLAWDQDPNKRPDFNDIVRLFDSGIILKNVIQDQELLDKYFRYTNYVSNYSLFSKNSLIELKNRLFIAENKLSLSCIVSFYLADTFNDPDSLKNIGENYMTGVNLKQNQKLGFEYLQRSAIRNNDEALFLLGQAYENGNGCELNIQNANECFRISANLGNTSASNHCILRDEMEKVDWTSKPAIIIIGSIKTGKTTFINSLTNNFVNAFPLQTVAATSSKMCLDDVKTGKKIYTEIFDIPGMDMNSLVVPPQIYRMANLAIVMFDISVPTTFYEINQWIDKLREYNVEASILVIGNKIDLDRAITLDEIKGKIASLGPDVKYVEISPLKQINIDQAKKKLLRN